MIAMLSFIGIGLIAAGVVVAIWGDKVVTEDSGVISKMVRWPPNRAQWLKFAIGGALIYAGAMMLVE